MKRILVLTLMLAVIAGGGTLSIAKADDNLEAKWQEQVNRFNRQDKQSRELRDKLSNLSNAIEAFSEPSDPNCKMGYTSAMDWADANYFDWPRALELVNELLQQGKNVLAAININLITSEDILELTGINYEMDTVLNALVGLADELDKVLMKLREIDATCD